MNDTDRTSSRKRFSSWWWLVIVPGVYMLFVVVRLFGLFDTGPVIEIGPETTVLTGPVREDGSIDYPLALDAEFREGVTHENNAAVLLVQAFGPEIFDNEVRQQSLDKLGFSDEPQFEPAFVEVSQYFEEQDIEFDQEIENDFVVEPWSREQHPVLAEWLEANEDPLDLIVQASLRSRYYVPFVSADPNGSLLEYVLPMEMRTRSAVRALSKRAMLRLHEGEIDAAIADTQAIFRLSRLMRDHPTLIGRLIAFAHNSVATECLTQIVLSGGASAAQMDAFAKSYRGLKSFPPMSETINRAERFMALDMAQGLALQRMPQGVQVPAFALRAVNANVMMRVLNNAYDELLVAMQIDGFQARVQELDQIEQAWTNKASKTSMLSLMLGSRSAISTSIANLLVSITLPASTSISESEFRMQFYDGSVHILIALGNYHVANSEFPDTLEDLVPSELEAIPVDPFSEEPIHYELTPSGGFRLISSGVDGVIGSQNADSDDVVLPESDID